MHRKFLMCLLTIALLSTVPFAGAQQPGRSYRVGYVSGGFEAARKPFLDSFRQGMRELGYVEGQNLVLETRFASGKFARLPSLFQELIRLKPDVLFVSTTPANLAAKAATSTIPIVFVAVADPLGVGLVASLARPGGNITGITNIIAELAGKRLELLKEVVPKATQVAVLVNPDDPNAPFQMKSAEAAARALGVQLHPVLEVRRPDDLRGAFAAAARAGAGAGLRMADPLTTALRSPRPAADQVRADHQLEDRQADRPDHSAECLGAGGQGDQVKRRQKA